MSRYSTGELAKLCGVTVRTVQYYDTRGILTPSELSEGGRRLYTEEDYRRLRIICFLRDLGLSIDAIGLIFKEEHPEEVIALLLEEQKQELSESLAETRERLRRVELLQTELEGVTDFSIDSLDALAEHIEGKKDLCRLRILITAVGLLMDVIQVATVALWITRGIWWPFALGMTAVVGLGVWVTLFYFRRTAYICPSCHHVFAPSLKEVLWAHHTPKTRKLTCPHCRRRGFCVETLRRGEKDGRDGENEATSTFLERKVEPKNLLKKE